MNNRTKESIRRPHGGYSDRNDGFERTHFSRSKRNRARHTKAGKVRRVKAPWKAVAA